MLSCAVKTRLEVKFTFPKDQLRLELLRVPVSKLINHLHNIS